MSRTARMRLVAILLAMLAPAAGLLLSGKASAAYLEFPPRTRYISHAPFSWQVFSSLALFTLVVVTIAVGLVLRQRRPRAAAPSPARGRFPSWGWIGLGAGAGAWVLAWTRLPHAAWLQPYTFIPLWLSYIVVVNGLAQWRNGSCPLLADRRAYALLFPLSAAFWWYFEYLNRFVQNWFYEGVEGFSPGGYLLCASLSFATVLPAVVATEALLSGSPLLAGLERPPRSRPPSRRGAARMLGLGCLAMLLLPRFPNGLFPFLWLAPVAVLGGGEALSGRRNVLTDAAGGNWGPAVRFALAALVCGFFWEMWNDGSHARWIYAVPYVNRFHLFEMPILGYAGYLPFGLECALVAGWVLPGTRRS